MNRRLAIQHLIIISSGAALLPNCTQNKGGTTLTLKNISIPGKDQAMLAILTQAIIPSISSTGAKELKSHEFALKMIDDCSAPEDQKKFIEGIKEFDELTLKQYGNSFTALDKPSQNKLLLSLEKGKDIPGNVSRFYRTIKDLTLQSYTSSEYYMVNVMKYNIIPKKYRGCVRINNT